MIMQRHVQPHQMPRFMPTITQKCLAIVKKTYTYLTTLGVLTFGEIDQEYDKYYGAITADIRRAKMIELYNKDNIKVYVDDDERYSITPIFNWEFILKDKKNDTGIVYLLKRKAQGITITVKGNTLTLEGILLGCTINNYGYNITLKGDVRAWVAQEYRGPNVYTHNLYGSSKIIADANDLTKHNYLLHDSAYLQIEGTGSIDTCEIFAYDDSVVETITGCTIIIYDTAEARTATPDAEIYAYDNSKVVSWLRPSEDDKNIHLFDNAKRANY
jgi:hypothetical protein